MTPRAPVDWLTGLEAAQFALYVHFPFCLSKCPYCDFASTVSSRIPQEAYTDAVIAELRQRATGLAGRALHSIFFGGGTPSLWEPAQMARLLREVKKTFDWSPEVEVTLEANPGAADAARFAAYREVGINRLSMGVQSFDAQTLKTLGRAHGPDEAWAAFASARRAGFSNVSLDFIYGVHGQSLEQSTTDAREAARLSPEHLSAYALTLDKESLAEEVPLARALARGEVQLPPDDTVLSMQRAVALEFERAGLLRYEVSNYAKPNLHSRHNAAYWTGGEYLALGVGATGCLATPARGLHRYSNVRSAEKYLKGVETGISTEVSHEDLSAADALSERIAMGLRLTRGINLAAACEHYGVDAGARLARTQAWVKRGCLRYEGDFVSLTPEGFDVHSAIAADLM